MFIKQKQLGRKIIWNIAKLKKKFWKE
jgi:hypothetical protein